MGQFTTALSFTDQLLEDLVLPEAKKRRIAEARAEMDKEKEAIDSVIGQRSEFAPTISASASALNDVEKSSSS